jgi:hypothetical protein
MIEIVLIFVSQTKDKDAPEEKNVKFCRVILPDGSTTVVCAKPGQNVRTVLGRLCEKRSLSIAAVDVFLLGSDKVRIQHISGINLVYVHAYWSCYITYTLILQLCLPIFSY